MEIILNGKKEFFTETKSLDSLIEDKVTDKKKVVVEYNLEIVDKEKWKNIILKYGDKVEILSFIGGG